MSTTQTTKAIWFDTDKNGRKVAYYWRQRAFRMSVVEAEADIANGVGYEISGHPLR